MEQKNLQAMTVEQLRALARERGVRIPARSNKGAIVALLMDEPSKPAPAAAAPQPEATAAPQPASEPAAARPTPARRAAPRDRAARQPQASAAQANRAQASAPQPQRRTPAPRTPSPAPAAAQEGPSQHRAQKAASPENPRRAIANRTPSRAARTPQVAQPNRTSRAAQDAPAQPRASHAPSEGPAPRPRGRVPARRAEQPAEERVPTPETVERVHRAPAPSLTGLRAAEAGQEAPVRAAAEAIRRETEPAPEPAEIPIPRPAEEAEPALRDGDRPQPSESDVLTNPDFSDGSGLLEILETYGILRAENCQPGPGDIYISNAQIRRFNLRQGDFVEGRVRPAREGDRYGAMVYVSRVNGEGLDVAIHRKPFESLVPLYPDERLRMEDPVHPDMSLRLIDILAPIGKGQRGMIVSQPKAGKTTLLKKIANAISRNNPEVELIVLLIDERPEEVTDMKRSIQGKVIYSTFDEAPENHARVSEMVLEHAQRMVEMGKDVVILLDSITRLARAYNLVIPPTGRSLSGGLDPGALYRPKRFFGAARNIENGGSLTIIATALVDTGSRMDEIIFEEFKGTGNMELHLDRKLSDKRIFPAIDLNRSGTRREELLLSPEELDGAYAIRRLLSNGNTQENMELLLSLMEKTASNADFLKRIKGWLSLYQKEGYTMGGK